MFARRIGSATATTARRASKSDQRPRLYAAPSTPGVPGRLTVGSSVDGASDSDDGSASFVAGGVLTRPEYTVRGERRGMRDEEGSHRSPLAPSSGCSRRGGAVRPARRDEAALGRQFLGDLVMEVLAQKQAGV